ncbi:MAG: class I SAM-dependent methyltransferase [Rhodospirillales bacterium]|jgi:SAM-dependent methyltransferase|nr:class I SAM-dependent methyltransferase [Rhodospirillales bacterium]
MARASSAEAATPRQTWDPERYGRDARFVSEYGFAVVDALAPTAGERILDLGCGDGALSALVRERGADVIGLDSSPEQVAVARARGIAARLGDGSALSYESEFDAVFSNAALHWMRPPRRVIAGVERALKPGGRFVGELGGAGNIGIVTRALARALAARGLEWDGLDPWYFPDAEEYRRALEEGGFRVASIALFPRPTPIPGHLSDWLEIFTAGLSGAVPESGRAAFLAEVCDAAAPELCDSDGRWTVDYVRLRFVAHKPAPVRGAR